MKLRVGLELTEGLRIVANYNKISMQKVARIALLEYAENPVGFDFATTPLHDEESMEDKKGTVIDIDSGLFPFEIRGILSDYVSSNMPDLDKYWGQLAREIEELRIYVIEYKESLGGVIYDK